MAEVRMTNNALNPAAETRRAQAMRQAVQRVMCRCDQLAGCTDRPGEITRLFCSPAMRAAHAALRGWMEAAGMHCRLDPAGNLIGRLEPEGVASTGSTPASHSTLPALLIGSHLDSVVNAGKYDGTLGVLLGLAVAEIAAEVKIEMPFALEIIGFSEEEGVRYQSPYFGSRALVGDVPVELLERQDANGIALASALGSFGGNPDRLAQCVYRAEQVVAFIEPHIEQGPTLDDESIPVGVVTGIVGQSRASLHFVGRAEHAGTVPMASRHDALAAAAHFMVELEHFAAETSGLVATIGRVEVLPNVANVIPGEVRLRLDLRHADDERRLAAFREVVRRADVIAHERGLECKLLDVQEEGRVDLDITCTRLLEQSVLDAGVRPVRLPSGAGHDAVVMARYFSTAMLFVRCAGGVSHRPDESVSESDVRVALDVLCRFVEKLAESCAQAGALSAFSPKQQAADRR
jgi:allantoate deiminase